MTIAAAEDELSLAERLFLDFVDAEELPVAAMVEASGAWEECRAFFLETLRGYAAGDIDPTGDGDAPLILIHLLGQQRERLAWLPLIALLRQDIDTLEAALGDALTDTLPRILVGVFDGDPTPLEELLVDTSVDGSCRWSAFDAYIGLHVRGAFGAERMERLLTRVAETEIPADDMAWIAWLKGCALLADATLRDRAAALCAAGRIAPAGFEPGDMEEELERWRDGHQQILDETAPIEDAAALLATWHGYSEAGIAERRKASLLGGSIGRDTHVNPYRGIGRNDTCPCGSGKKFKRCHGASA
jgi:hypothetical protein